METTSRPDEPAARPLEGPARHTSRVSLVLDFLPALLVDLAIYLVSFTIQHVLADRLEAEKIAAGGWLVLFSSTYTGSYIVGTSLVGKFGDRPEWRTRSQLLGNVVALLVASALLVPRLPLPAYYVAIAVLGGGSALFWPACQARIGERWEPENLPSALARFNVGWTVGKALGFLFAGELYRLGPAAALGLGGVAALVCIALVAFDRAAPRARRKEKEGPSERPAFEKRGFLVGALATNFAVWGTAAMVTTLVPLLEKQLDISVAAGGQLLSVLTLAQTAMFFCMKGNRWAYRAAPLVATGPAAALCAGAFALASGEKSLLAAAAVTGLVTGSAYAFSIFYSLDYDERRGLRMGVNEAVLGLGGLLVPFAGNAIAGQGDVRNAFLFAGSLSLVAGLVSAAFLVRRRHVDG